jgi:hypothetical protein
MQLADEIRRWRQTRRSSTGLPPATSVHRIAVADREVLVVRRRVPRSMIGRGERAPGAAGQ